MDLRLCMYSKEVLKITMSYNASILFCYIGLCISRVPENDAKYNFNGNAFIQQSYEELSEKLHLNISQIRGGIKSLRRNNLISLYNNSHVYLTEDMKYRGTPFYTLSDYGMSIFHKEFADFNWEEVNNLWI